MKIVVASDSFKDSLSSAEVASAVRAGALRAVSDAEVVCLAVGDGGEGTAEVLTESLGGRIETCRVSDPLGRPVEARYGIVETPDGWTALVDMASASGLQLLTEEERDPLKTTSRGLGEMILDAYGKGARRFTVGIGGSATTDAGLGLLSALGYRFLDSEGCELSPVGESLSRVASIDFPEARCRDSEWEAEASSPCRDEITECPFTIICDVSNPLFGPEGAAYVYGPQKGADASTVRELDLGLRHFAEVVANSTGRGTGAALPGSGAAGGVGYAFRTFFNAELKPGVEAVLDIVGFDRVLDGADLVITGEGRIDRQTKFGKLPTGVLRRTREAGVPVVAVGGSVESEAVTELLEAGFSGIFPILSRPMALSEALRTETAKKNIESVAESIVRLAATTLKLIKP